MSTLVLTSATGSATYEPGHSVTVGRDHDCDLRLDSAVVSRHHGTFSSEGAGWTYRDDTSSLGSWVDGVRVRSVPINAPTTITLGQGEKAVVLAVDTHVDTRRPGGPLAEPLDGDATITSAEELTVQCAGQTYRLLPGTSAVIGRADDATVRSTNPRVSRHHALIEHTGGHWELVDTGSAGGVFHKGSRIESVTLTGVVDVVLGDPDPGVGEPLRASSEGSTTKPWEGSRDALRRSLQGLGSRRPIAAGVAVVLASTLGLGGWGLARAIAGAQGPDLERLARASVRVVTDTGSGSGTVVDARRGLILTNAHVAAADSPGRGARTGQMADALGKAPTRITIATSPGVDQPAVATYRAEVVAADGYLDLAVLRITTDSSDRPLAEDGLAKLVDVELGRSSAVRSADPVWVVGYPGLADSDAPTYTRGVISGTVRDKRLKDAVFLFNSDARINPGNSGGLAADADGHLVAVPTLNKRTREDSLLAGLVPVDLAGPLIEAARKGTAYTSPWVAKEGTGSASGFDIVPPGNDAGLTTGCTSGSRSTSRLLGVSFTLSGLSEQPHQDLLVTVSRQTAEGEQLLGRTSAADQWPLKLPASGCVTATVDIGRSLTLGTYVIRVGVGPNHTRVGTLTYRLS